MARKSEFSLAEWKRMVQSPLVAGFAVSAADPSGFIGLLQEALAAARSLSEARAPSSDALIRSIAEELLTTTGRAARGSEASRSRRPERRRGAGGRQSRRTYAAVQGMAASYNARMVAEAGLEDTFLGFGGVRMSEREKAALHEIAAALALEQPA